MVSLSRLRARRCSERAQQGSAPSMEKLEWTLGYPGGPALTAVSTPLLFPFAWAFWVMAAFRLLFTGKVCKGEAVTKP